MHISHTEPFEHGRIFLQRLPYLVVANAEQMFYNNHIATWMCGSERVVTLDGRETVDYQIALTDYEGLIIETVHDIKEKWILEQIYRFIKNITKED